MTDPQRGLLRVAGVAGGLASSSVAVVTRRIDGTTLANSQTFTSRGRRGATAAEHRARIAEQAGTVDHAVGPVVLVVIEDLAAAATGGDRALYRATRARLRARVVPVVVACPGTRAPGGDHAEHARFLAQLGAVRLGWDVLTLEHHRDALAGICWAGEPRRSHHPEERSAVTAEQQHSTAPGVSVLPSAGDHGQKWPVSCENVGGDHEETAGRESRVTGWRPRCSPAAGLPRISEGDRPDPVELDQVRQQLQRRPPLIVRGR